MNPDNQAYWDSLDNHANQLNPNNDEYQRETAWKMTNGREPNGENAGVIDPPQ